MIWLRFKWWFLKNIWPRKRFPSTESAIVASEALRILENSLDFAPLINRDWSDEFKIDPPHYMKRSNHE